MARSRWLDLIDEKALLPSMIPEKYRPWADALGLPALLAMCDLWGGTQHNFPPFDFVKDKALGGMVSSECVPARDRPLVAHAGIMKYLALLEVVGGRQVYIPFKESLLRPLRDRAIRAEYGPGGKSALELALKYDMTCAAITKCCKSLGLGQTKTKRFRRKRVIGR